MSAAKEVHRGMMTPRRMLEILRDYGFEDVAAEFEVINVIGSARTGGSDEWLYRREDLHECQAPDCENVFLRESDLRHGLCESCIDTAAINNQQNAMSRDR